MRNFCKQNFYSIPELNKAIVAIEGVEQTNELDEEQSKVLSVAKHLVEGLEKEKQKEQALVKGGS